MSGNELTLNQLFSLEEAGSQGQLSGMEATDTMSSLKEKLQKEAKVRWPVAFGMVLSKLSDALDIGVLDIMASGLKKYAGLLKYTDRQKYPPTDSYLVSLAEHTVKSEHNPSLDILVNDKPVGKISFNFIASLMFKGVVLKIQDARIMEVMPGSCKGKGTLKCEGVVVLEKETEWVSMPGSFKLGEGIPIAPYR